MPQEEFLLNLFGNWMAINNLKPTDSNQVCDLVKRFMSSDYYKSSNVLLTGFKCDYCGATPSLVITTPKGTFCQQHVNM